MAQRVRRKHDLDPDGVRIIVNWNNLLPSMSAFIPCLDTEKAKHQILGVCNDLGYEITLNVVVYRGKLGIRVRRVA